MKRLSWLLLFLLPLFASASLCLAKEAPKIPPDLTPWVDWVLHDHQEEQHCLPLYNNADQLQCQWPTELLVELDDTGGTFRQSWYLNYQGWIELPGAARQWPQEVMVDGKQAVVLQKNNRPRLKLGPGNHTISGGFQWRQLPEYVQVPSQSALVSLQVNGKKINFPQLDSSGRLWLKTTHKEEKIENRLKVQAFRLIDDTIPAQLTVYGTLEVAGSAREIRLGPIYAPDRFIPLSLTASLPSKLEQNGEMRVQVKPGRFSFSLTLRDLGQLRDLTFTQPHDGFWPDREVWLFSGHPNIRIVEITGGTPIDPLRTSAPKIWQKFPAYQMLGGETIRFQEIKRGDPHPAPDQLILNRELWLRFDGSGYTIQDNISGKKNNNWRLEMNPAIALGRVAVDGVEQLITRRQGSKKTGVELRRGRLNLAVDSGYQGNIATLPATGWDHDFQKVSGHLRLPPGWKLISASGIDQIPGTWVKKWTLLDFFIVLIFTIAMAKLFSKPLALVAFLTMVLTFHEPGAPRYVWLALLIGFALLKNLDGGKLRQVVKGYQALTLLILILLAIPYSITTLRVGIYPQLAHPWISMSDYSQQNRQAMKKSRPMTLAEKGSGLKAPEMRDMAQTADGISKKAARRLTEPMGGMNGLNRNLKTSSQVNQYDPKSLTQTGPGLPQWQPFQTIPFSWSGPVHRDQVISLWLIGPKTNLVLAFVRVFLIIALGLSMFGLGYNRGQGINFNRLKPLLLLPLFLVPLLAPTVARANEIPSQPLLDELQQRLLEKDDCFPNCADISEMRINIDPQKLTISLTAESDLAAAFPLPGNAKQWLPQQVSMDGNPCQALFRKANSLWVMAPAGKHHFELRGRIGKQNTLQLPFPLKPHRAVAKARGWSVDGIHPDGSFDKQLQFKRIVEHHGQQGEILETGLLPPFARVEREILLGLTWKVVTKVQRIKGSSGSAMILNIPLLPGESVTSEGVRIQDKTVQVNMAGNQNLFRWESFLEPSDTIVLRHPNTSHWTEVWKVDASPIFHLETSGIPVIQHQEGNRWLPTWHPWPKEEVVLTVSRPKGIEGQTLTIEKSHLSLHPGQRSTDGVLRLTIKSSQGGQHSLSLPEDASLQEVKIDGRVQPIRQEGRQVILPIHPGNQEVELQWRQATGMSMRYTTPSIDLNSPSVNASVDLHLPHNRWPLFMGGEQLVGPAILFWSALIIILLVAFGLSKSGLTPLHFYQWLLLGIGLSMSNLGASLAVVGWLITLDQRKKAAKLDKQLFNLIQVGIVFLTVMAMASLVFAISQGLIGHPDMNIVGNGSRRNLLRWYQDVSGPMLPRAWVFSLPMLTYRLAMLAWALWVSFGLLKVLKWGWQRFTEPTIWYGSTQKKPLLRPNKAEEQANPASSTINGDENQEPADK